MRHWKRGRDGGEPLNDMRKPGRDHFDGGNGSMVIYMCQTHQIIHFTPMQFTKYGLYLNN